MILLILSGILILFIFLFCGDKGAKSIISTAMNALCLLAALFAIHRGLPVLPVTLCLILLITVITLFYQNEVSPQSKAAFLSVVLVVLVTVPLVLWFAAKANSQGFNPEEYELTDSNGYTRNIHLNMFQIQVAVMLIALTGTVIDEAVAITSSLAGILDNRPDLALPDLIASGFQVSRAVLATSIHTIFYIYAAEYMTLMIQYVSDNSFVYIINAQSLAGELISVAMGGVGCCLIVPCATLLGSLFLTRAGENGR